MAATSPSSPVTKAAGRAGTSVSHCRAVRRVRWPTPRNDAWQELRGSNCTFSKRKVRTHERRESQGPAGRRRQGSAAADRDAADGGGLRGDGGGVGRAGAGEPGGGAPAGGGDRPEDAGDGRPRAVRCDSPEIAVLA